MMHRLKKIVEQVWDEAMGGQEYAMCALNVKDEDRSLAEAYFSMANQELTHAETLMVHASRIAQADENIRAIWDWEHEKVMKQIAKAKTMLDMYRK